MYRSFTLMKKGFVRKGMSPVAEIDRVYGTIGSRLRHERVHGATFLEPGVPFRRIHANHYGHVGYDTELGAASSFTCTGAA
jgi:hypothetical protein